MDKPYHFDLNERIVYFFGASRIDFADWTYGILDMVVDNAIPKPTAVLIDMPIDSRSLSIEQLQRIESLLELIRLRFDDRIALVSAQVGNSALIHLAAARIKSDSCRAFLLEREAIEWLKSG